MIVVGDRIRFIPPAERKRDTVRADDPFGVVQLIHDGGGHVTPYLLVVHYHNGRARSSTIPIDRAEPI